MLKLPQTLAEHHDVSLQRAIFKSGNSDLRVSWVRADRIGLSWLTDVPRGFGFGKLEESCSSEIPIISTSFSLDPM